MAYVQHAFGTLVVEVPIGDDLTVAGLAGVLGVAGSYCPPSSVVTGLAVSQAPDSGAPRVVVKWARR